MIIERYTDMAGRIRILWQTQDGDTMLLKFLQEPTQQQLAALEAQYLERKALEANPRIELIAEDDRELIVEVIRRIRQNPAITAPQFSTYLNTLSWGDKAEVQTFIRRLANALAAHYGVDISDATEAAIFRKVRDWIANTELKKLRYVLNVMF